MLGKKIKSLREKAKISLAELARRSSISVTVLNRLEEGSIRHIPMSDLLLITDNLHIKRAREFLTLTHLNKYHEDFKLYNVGIGKTGTHSIAAVFGNYRSHHQFIINETLEVIKRY